MLEEIKPLWEKDGLRLLEHRWFGERVQLAFSTRPDVAPVLLAARAKGRLQYALRHAMADFPGFSRKVALRSVGDNTRQEVEAYIGRQVSKEHFVDPRFEEFMKQFTVQAEADLSQPRESSHGRYWYNLHLVLVAAERYRVVDRNRLTILRDGCRQIARKKHYQIASESVMPDHIHLALRGNIEHSPREVALAFQNNLAYLLGQVRFWNESFYVGTFSEYDMGAIRSGAREISQTPASLLVDEAD
jgi:REP element-mobilizing transposase RayT